MQDLRAARGRRASEGGCADRDIFQTEQTFSNDACQGILPFAFCSLDG